MVIFKYQNVLDHKLTYLKELNVLINSPKPPEQGKLLTIYH